MAQRLKRLPTETQILLSLKCSTSSVLDLSSIALESLTPNKILEIKILSPYFKEVE